MADFSTTMKNVVSVSVKFIVNTAKTAAKAIKFKMDEMSNLSKRRDLIGQLGDKVFELSNKGVQLPDEIIEIVGNIVQLDGELAIMRARRAADKVAAAEQHAAEKAARATEKAAAKSAAVIDKSTQTVEIEVPEAPAAADIEEMEESAAVPVMNIHVEQEENKAEEETVPTLNV